MGNALSLISGLEVVGYVLLLKWAYSLRLPADPDRSVGTLVLEIRRAAHIAGSCGISLCIPFSLNILVMMRTPSLSREKIGMGLSVVGLSLYNLSCYRIAGSRVSPDALLLSGIIGLSGARLVLHHAYRLWNQDAMDASFDTQLNPGTILTAAGSASEENSFESCVVGRILSCLIRSVYIGMSNLMPYLSVVYSDPSTASTPIPGLSLVLAGTALLAVSEWQRDKQEMKDPDSMCTTGLYRYCRYPDSSAQMLFHLGVVLTCYSQAPYSPLVLASSLPHIVSILGIYHSVRRKDSFLQLTQVIDKRLVSGQHFWSGWTTIRMHWTLVHLVGLEGIVAACPHHVRYMRYRASTNLLIPKILY